MCSARMFCFSRQFLLFLLAYVCAITIGKTNTAKKKSPSKDASKKEILPPVKAGDKFLLKKFDFGEEKFIEIQGPPKQGDSVTWSGIETSGTVKSTAWDGPIRQMWLVKGLLKDVVKPLLEEAERASMDTTLDSVDKKPEFQKYIIEGMNPKGPMGKIVLPVIKQRIEPYVRKQYNCPDCIVCSSLVRRYLPGERRKHPRHFDAEAFVSAIMPLNVGNYEGGLYVQTGAHVDSRAFVDFEFGDVLFHQYDLEHGVHVEDGDRYSLIFWVKSNAKACHDDNSPWYREPAEAGNVDAQYAMSHALLAKYQYAESHKWMKKAGMQGHLDAMAVMGAWMISGENQVEVNVRLGANWTALAAKQGFAMAQFNLAHMYREGIGFKKDKAEAAKWLWKAAEQGHTEAMVNLAHMHLTGDGVPMDSATSIAWFEMAASYADLKAMVNLGIMHRAGEGVPRSDRIATEWFRKAAEQGDVDAQLMLGEAYQQGKGIKMDDKLSFKWFSEAAQQGNARAMIMLGVSYSVGTGVDADPEVAQKWFDKATALGMGDKVQQVIDSLQIEEPEDAEIEGGDPQAFLQEQFGEIDEEFQALQDAADDEF